MTIRYKLLLSFCFMLVLSSVMGLYGVGGIINLRNLTIHLYDYPMQSLNQAYSSRTNFIFLDHSLTSAITNSNDQQRKLILEKAEEFRLLSLEDLDISSKRFESEKSLSFVKELQYDLENLQALIKIIANDTGEQQDPSKLLNYKESLLAPLRGRFEQLVDTAVETGYLSSERATSMGGRIFIVQISVLATTLVLSLAAVYALSRNIVPPIQEMTKVMGSIAEGDYDTAVPGLNRSDEIGDMASALLIFKEIIADRAKILAHLKSARSIIERQEKLVTLGKLVAGITHEVNTPVGAAIAISNSLQSDLHNLYKTLAKEEVQHSDLVSMKEKNETSFKLLIDYLRRVSHLMRSLKNVATDQTSSVCRRFHLYEMLIDITSTLEHTIKNTGIKCAVDGPRDLEVHSYPGPLGQVIINLFHNAVLHGFENENSGEILINFQRKGDSIELVFSDNGSGVKDEHMESLFAPFFATQQGEGGLGLGSGLSTVYNIVTNVLGGVITVKSNKGTTFQIDFPITAASHG